MNSIGPDALVFGVDHLAAYGQYLIDYGLKDAGGGRVEALTGAAVVLRVTGDPALPPVLGTASLLRETVYGVAGTATLDAIEAELRRDRELSRRDGVLRCADGTGRPTEVPLAGTRLIEQGYGSFRGPGRHPYGREGNAADGMKLCAPHGPQVAELLMPRIASPDVPGGQHAQIMRDSMMALVQPI